MSCCFRFLLLARPEYYHHPPWALVILHAGLQDAAESHLLFNRPFPSVGSLFVYIIPGPVQNDDPSTFPSKSCARVNHHIISYIGQLNFCIATTLGPVLPCSIVIPSAHNISRPPSRPRRPLLPFFFLVVHRTAAVTPRPRRMVVRLDRNLETMDSSSASQAATTSALRLPLRPLGLRDVSGTTPSLRNPDWRNSAASSLAVESSLRSPTGSCCSHDSFPESETTMSTAPSSPRSPSAKQEYTDVQLRSIPSRRPSLRPDGDTRLPPLLKRSSSPGVLPGLNSILNVPRIAHPQEPSLQGSWTRKYSSSPEPQASGEYVLSRYSSVDPRSQDPITEYLNEERRRRSIDHRYRGESAAADALDLPTMARASINLDYSKPRFCRRSSYDYPGQSHSRGADPLRHVQQGAIRRDPAHGGSRRKDAKAPHINKRYSKEQMAFIRYLKIDCNLTWEQIAVEVKKRFPEEGIAREVQGVQGVYYRQNKIIPDLDVQTNVIAYLPNGHMKGVAKGCRNQKDKKLYGLLNLWPEDAIRYDWVSERHKEVAKKLGRLPLRSLQKRCHRANTWSSCHTSQGARDCQGARRRERSLGGSCPSRHLCMLLLREARPVSLRYHQRHPLMTYQLRLFRRGRITPLWHLRSKKKPYTPDRPGQSSFGVPSTRAGYRARTAAHSLPFVSTLIDFCFVCSASWLG